MSDVIKGSFEWAIQQIKEGKRATRTGWCGQNMFLLRNPGLVGLVVEKDDFRAKAGVPVDTAFNYLPNIEICNTDGNYVPWTPSQVDMEAMDWAAVADDSQHRLVLDIKSGYRNYSGPPKSQVWGYNYTPSSNHGELTIIEDNIPLAKDIAPVPMFYYSEGAIRGTIGILFTLSEDPEGAIRNSVVDRAIKFTVDGDVFDLGLPSRYTHSDYSQIIQINYFSDELNGDRDAFSGVIEKLKKVNTLTRYCLDWYDIIE
jgi:hypothetical protein